MRRCIIAVRILQPWWLESRNGVSGKTGAVHNGDMLRPFEIECELKKLQFELGMWVMSKVRESEKIPACLGFLSNE